jgi:hypothetical protein
MEGRIMSQPSELPTDSRLSTIEQMGRSALETALIQAGSKKAPGFCPGAGVVKE